MVYNLQTLYGTTYISYEVDIILYLIMCCTSFIPTAVSHHGITVMPLALHRAFRLALLESELLPLVHNIR